jgi:zinc protease
MMLRLSLFLLALATPVFAPPALAEVPIQQVTSKQGLKAWLVEEHGIPFTALQIRFAGGTSLDAVGKRGAVNLMTALIEEGAGDLDSQGFAAARDGLAASFQFSSNADGISVSARFLTENRDQAVALLTDALTKPRFDQDAIDRVRGQVLSGIESDAKDPSSIAGRLESARQFGDHPYGTDASGTAASVNALTRDDILAAHAGALARDRVTIAAAGDITPDQLDAILNQILGALPQTGAPLPERALLTETGGLTVSDFPSPQSVVLFGHGGLRVDDPDFMAASIVNEIFGGDRFTARLMTEVRDKRGLTYGIGTGLASMQYSELLSGQFQAANEKVADAIQVVTDEWGKMAKGDISQAELDATKTYMIGAYPLRFDGNGTIASILVGMQVNGFPIDYPKTRNDRLRAITLDDVNRVAKRLFKPENLHFTVVGQPVGLQ